MVRKKHINYLIILTINGKKKKVLFSSKTKEETFSEFRKLLKNNKEIIFPKKYTNTISVKPCEYKILLLKRINLDEKPINIFDEDWEIILENKYNLEETFMMYRFDSKLERKNIFDLVEILIKQNDDFKEVIIVHNKILFYNELFFDMVICKCSSDAKRLNNLIYQLFRRIRNNKYIFLGVAKLENISFLYDLIEEETQWPRERIRRTSTRP